jgi:hypothetical protein
MVRLAAILTISVVCCGGCASITRGTTEMISFDSDPSGAEMRTTTGLGCVTPCTLSVPRKDEFQAMFTKPGYEPQEVFVRNKVVATGAAGFAGNVILGGVVGMGVDIYNGAGLDHEPNPVRAVLRPVASPPPPAALRPPRKRIDPSTLTQ